MRDLQLEEIGIDSNDHGIVEEDAMFATEGESSEEMPEDDDDEISDDEDDDEDDDEISDEGDEPDAEIED